jgi:hypothetical protein
VSEDTRYGATGAARPSRISTSSPPWRPSSWSWTSPRPWNTSRRYWSGPSGGSRTRCASWPTSTPSRGAASSCGSSPGGWRFYSRPEYAPAVEGFVLDGQQARLTQAALETLAVVAYRQPVSRSRVSAVRGVNCDGVMRTLLQRGLVEEAGTEPETGAILYRTTNYFLERMGLRGLDELPELAPFLPEAGRDRGETLEGVPSFDPDAPDADADARRRRNFDAKQWQCEAAAGTAGAATPAGPAGAESPGFRRRRPRRGQLPGAGGGGSQPRGAGAGGATTSRSAPESPVPRSAATT